MISANTTEVQEGGTATVEFTAESFSVYGVIYSDAQLKKTVIAASGESYEITVTYGADAEIPDGAELIVEEVLPGDKEYKKNCKAAEKALRAEYDEGLSAHTVDFDISIVFEGETIEPAPNSTVSVEIRLVGDAFADEDTAAENAEQRTEDELIEEGFALYNGTEYEAEGLNNVQSANVIHIKEDSADIIELSDEPLIQDGQLVLKFETDSFSDYIVTGSTSGGENYTVDGLPSVIYVGDTINLFWTQYSTSYNLNGHATATAWDDRYNISGRNYARGVVIQATGTGWITVGNKNIEIRPKPAGSHPATVTTVPNASIGVKMNMFDYDLKSSRRILVYLNVSLPAWICDCFFIRCL